MIEWKHWLSKPTQEPNEIINENIQINKYKTNRHLIWGQSNVCISSYERCCTNPFMGYIKKINPLCKKFFSKKTESFVDIHFITGLKKHTSKKRALLISRGDQNFGKPTIIQKIFDTNSIFHVKWRTTGKVEFLLFKSFLLTLTKFSFWQEDWTGRLWLSLSEV